MKETDIDQILENICQEQIEPPEHLVVYTKQRLKRSPFLNLVMFISLFLNALVAIAAAAVLFWPGLGWATKIPLYFGITVFFDGLIVLILLYREKVTTFFREFTYADNHLK
jgi:hypothetical protein